MKPRRLAVLGLAALAAVAVVVLASRDEQTSVGLVSGPTPTPPAARLLACAPRFERDGSSYQVRSVSPFRPGARLGRARVEDCHDASRTVFVSVHAYEGVDPKVAVGIRNGMTLLALAPSGCLGLRDARLVRCLRATG